MKKTLTLPESEIITLAKAAKEHGTVELQKPSASAKRSSTKSCADTID